MNNVSLSRLREPGCPAIDRDQALTQALGTAHEIADSLMDLPGPSFISGATGTGIFSDPSFMTGSAGIRVFLQAALLFETDPAWIRRYKDLCSRIRDSLAQRIRDLAARKEKQPGLMLDLSLASGLSGILHALLLTSRISGHMDPELLRAVIRLVLSDGPSGPCLTDYYLGLAGRISVLSDLLDQAESLPLPEEDLTLSAAPALRDLLDLLMAARTAQVRMDPVPAKKGLMLWDTIGSRRVISGLGHGMAGIAAALLKGADQLEKRQAGLAEERLADYRRAAREALLFETAAYDRGLCDWPDLRPRGAGKVSLHGICSGAPGIGLILMRLEAGSVGTLAEERKRLLSLSRESCLGAPLRREDHLCCGKAGLCEYLLTRYDLYGDASDLGHAGRLLAQMAKEKAGRDPGRYTLLPAIPERDSSLFYGSAGIAYELLRFHAPGLLPPLL